MVNLENSLLQILHCFGERETINQGRETETNIIEHSPTHSPITVTTMVRSRARMSHSK
jgi:hypothetical protein